MNGDGFKIGAMNNADIIPILDLLGRGKSFHNHHYNGLPIGLLKKHFELHSSKHGVGDQYRTLDRWCSIITEEWGEVVCCVNDRNLDEFDHEIGQTIACLYQLWAVAHGAYIDRNGWVIRIMDPKDVVE